jgi:hypothetical protein
VDVAAPPSRLLATEAQQLAPVIPWGNPR